MRHDLLFCTTALWGALSFIAAGANAAASDDTPDYSDWYQVEIIVFAENNPSPSDEIWPRDQALAYPADMLAIAPTSPDDLQPPNLDELQQLLAGAETKAAAGSVPAQDSGDGQTPPSPESSQDLAAETAAAEQILQADRPVPFQILPKNAMHLNGIAGSIRRSSTYRIIVHTAWLQPITAQSDSYPVLIQAGQRVGNAFEVDGTLTMSRSRYLHVNTDLWFTQFTKTDEGASPLPTVVSEMNGATQTKYSALIAAQENKNNFAKVQTYRMHLSRRMRSGTLHYLDNPLFGVLIEANEFKYSLPDAEQSSAPTPSPDQ